MTLYELINPSDTVTFYAESEMVAVVCTKMLSGMYFVENADTGESIDENVYLKQLESEIDAGNDWIADHLEELATCYESFAYASKRQRKEYELALELIDDPAKREQFKAAHEDSNRTSLTPIVNVAWGKAGVFRQRVSERKEGKGE